MVRRRKAASWDLWRGRGRPEDLIQWFIAPKKMVIECVDLKAEPFKVKLKEPFTRLMRMIVHLHWTAATTSWANFADAAALDPGMTLTHENVDIGPIVNNSGFGHFGYDTNLKQDLGAVKQNVLESRLSFHKFVPGGLPMGAGFDFTVETTQDMSLIGDELFLTFEGWRFK